MYRAVVVDDEPYMREGMRLLIDWTGCGFTLVGEAQNGQEALVLLAETQPDLMICDVRMPGMLGTELAGQARALYPQMEIAFISGHQDFAYAQAAIRAQAHCYLLKPMDPDEIHPKLREIARKLDQRSMESTGSLSGLHSASDASPAPAQPEPPTETQTLDAVWAYIEQHYAHKPSLADLAAHLHLHQGYLGQWIKRETGQTFHQHITRRRMQEAQRLLRQSNQTIKQIAAAVGIGDEDYFSSQFRKWAGKTPGQFRRR